MEQEPKLNPYVAEIISRALRQLSDNQLTIQLHITAERVAQTTDAVDRYVYTHTIDYTTYGQLCAAESAAEYDHELAFRETLRRRP